LIELIFFCVFLCLSFVVNDAANVFDENKMSLIVK